VVPYAAVNHFWHAARLLDLSNEPIILTHPDMGERYFTVQLAGFTSDKFDYIGQRTSGKAAGDFAGPG
jgi:hypothetical protein